MHLIESDAYPAPNLSVTINRRIARCRVDNNTFIRIRQIILGMMLTLPVPFVTFDRYCDASLPGLCAVLLLFLNTRTFGESGHHPSETPCGLQGRRGLGLGMG